MAKRFLIATNSRESTERSFVRRQLTSDVPGIVWIESDADVDAFVKLFTDLNMRLRDVRLTTVWFPGSAVGPSDEKLRLLKMEEMPISEGLIWLMT